MNLDDVPLLLVFFRLSTVKICAWSLSVSKNPKELVKLAMAESHLVETPFLNLLHKRMEARKNPSWD